MGFDNLFQSFVNNYGSNLSELVINKGIRAAGNRYVKPKLYKVLFFLIVITGMNLLGTWVLCMKQINTFSSNLIASIIFFLTFIFFVVFFIKWCIAVNGYIKFGRSTYKIGNAISEVRKVLPKKPSKYDLSGLKPRSQPIIAEAIKIFIPTVILLLVVGGVYFCVMKYVFLLRLEGIYEDINFVKLIVFPFYHSYKFILSLIS